MFKRAKLSFGNQAVFEKDFKPAIDNAFCVVSKMMWFNRINIDGSINMEQSAFLKKHELWSYIYYLYYYNHSSLDVFSKMKNQDNGKASAYLFWSVVADVVQNQFALENKEKTVPFDANTLIYFVNLMVQKYGEDLTNPVVQYLRQLVNNPQALAQLQKFTVVTGRPPGSFEMTKDKNADISFTFRPS